jgi:ketosteroid isomerase-like protein
VPEQNVEVVRQVIEANRSDDLEARVEAVLALCDRGVEYTPGTAALETATTYHGHDGMRRYVNYLAESWAVWRAEVEEVLDIGPDTVLGTFVFHAIGKLSGAPVEARLAAVFVLSDGKLLRGRAYPSREHALEAAGLPGRDLLAGG